MIVYVLCQYMGCKAWQEWMLAGLLACAHCLPNEFIVPNIWFKHINSIVLDQIFDCAICIWYICMYMCICIYIHEIHWNQVVVIMVAQRTHWRGVKEPSSIHTIVIHAEKSTISQLNPFADLQWLQHTFFLLWQINWICVLSEYQNMRLKNDRRTLKDMGSLSNVDKQSDSEIAKNGRKPKIHTRTHTKKRRKAKLNVDKFIGRHQFSIVLSLRRNLWFHYIPS